MGVSRLAQRAVRTALIVVAFSASAALAQTQGATVTQPATSSASTTTTTTAPAATAPAAAGGAATTAATTTPSTGTTADNVSHPPDTVSDEVYGEMFKILFAVFVLAVVIESALALIFNWRPFLTRFDGRGVRSVIAFAVSWMVARALELDIIERLSEATNPRTDEGTTELGFILTGLVLAGGSAGVNNLLRSLGFRQLDRKEDITPKPPKTEAWVAVTLNRDNAVGPVNVLVEHAGQTPRIVGNITGLRKPARLFAWALTDPTRFPPVAGFRVPGGQQITVILEGRDETGAVIKSDWGPYTIEAGAILDIEIRL